MKTSIIYGHMSLVGHIISILKTEEVEPVFFGLFMLKINETLNHKKKLRDFISLIQTIEGRIDARNNYCKLTLSSICEEFGIPRSTFYEIDHWNSLLFSIQVNNYNNYTMMQMTGIFLLSIILQVYN